MSNPTLKSAIRISDPCDRFRALAQAYASWLREAGVEKLPYTDPALPVFSALPASDRERVNAAMQASLEVFEELKAEGTTLRDTPVLLWKSMRRLGLTPQSDIFDKIGADDVVEVYTLDQRQIFRNVAFFDVTSYTLEDVFGCDWKQVSRRDPKIEADLAAIGYKIALGEIQGTYACPLPEHEFVETGGDRLRFMIRVKYLSPLKAQGQLAAILAVSSVRSVPSGREP